MKMLIFEKIIIKFNVTMKIIFFVYSDKLIFLRFMGKKFLK